MKSQADKKKRNVSFSPGEMVYVKLQPYRQKSLVHRNNEKLAPRFYGSYKVLCRIGSLAYELQLPDYSRIHPVFHVSQLKQSCGSHSPLELPHQLIDDLEMRATPKALLKWRYNSAGKLEVLVLWDKLPDSDSTWEEATLMNALYPDFHLEDKVLFLTRGIATPFTIAKQPKPNIITY